MQNTFKIEQKLNKLYPENYISKYSLVSFGTAPYKDALAMGFKQDALFKEVLAIVYIDYELTKKIFNYRDEVAEIQSLEELKRKMNSRPLFPMHLSAQ